MPYIPIYLRTDLEADPPEYQDNHYEAFAKTNVNMEVFDQRLTTTVDGVVSEFERMTTETVEQITSQSVPYHAHHLAGGIDCGDVTEQESPIVIGIINNDAVYMDGGSFEG